jgi:hypothetical protein
MFRAGTQVYLINQESIRITTLQDHKVMILEIAADYIESPRKNSDKEVAFARLDAVRTLIMNMFSMKIEETLRI